jgi:hypothetical protein
MLPSPVEPGEGLGVRASAADRNDRNFHNGTQHIPEIARAHNAPVPART